MDKDVRLLIKLVILMIIIFGVALNYKEVMYSHKYNNMTPAQKVHELHKLGIPTEEESKVEMGQ